MKRFKKTSNNISKITTKNINVRSLKNNKKRENTLTDDKIDLSWVFIK